MSDPRLSSPSSIRLVAAAAAAVASLGVVALGVQLGTAGLVGDGPGRNPGSSSATPASASVDLPRTRPGTTLEDQLIALVPAVGATAFGSSSSSGFGTASAAPAPSDAAAAPTGPSDGGTSPAPSPVPTTPIPTPETPAAPTPALPAVPTLPPVLDPVVDPIDDALSGVGVAPTTNESGAAPSAAPTLDGLIRLLLGP
jgi:hypothetical protein